MVTHWTKVEDTDRLLCEFVNKPVKLITALLLLCTRRSCSETRYATAIDMLHQRMLLEICVKTKVVHPLILSVPVSFSAVH